MRDCGMQDAGFTGNIFTWCNNRDAPNTIWKRLDRFLHNCEWFDLYSRTTITHLARAYSDHSPPLIQFGNGNESNIKYFKFLNLWIEHAEFQDVVKNIWEEEYLGNPMWTLHQKLKKVSTRLSSWSRETYGDIFEDPKRLKKQIEFLEQLLVEDNNEDNRINLNKAKAEYT
ncbi:uncharacterized protein LOC142162598 [Nicotiana tabacum]|uniref:Uncharacterized protein LOC142162598 n=1 Tax=Nicotiana tabacum TaxID=4097 RepID=A0AC58RQF6_TOBAC